jgi:MFS family permease
MSNAETGTLGSVCLVGFTFGCLFVGTFMVRIPSDRVMWVVAGGFVCCAASALVFATCEPGTPRVVMLASRCLNGIGEAGVLTTGPPLITDIAPPERKSAFIGAFFAMIFVGTAFGVGLSSFGTTWSGAQALFVVETVCWLPFIIIAAAFPKYFAVQSSAPPTTPTRDPLLDSDAERSRAVKYSDLMQRDFLLVVFAYAQQTFYIGAVNLFVVKYITDTFHMDATACRVYFGIGTVLTGFTGSALGGVILDRLLDHYCNRQQVAVALAMVLSALAIPGVLVLPLIDSAAWFFILVFFGEFLCFLTAAPINLGYMDAVSPDMRGMAVGFNVLCIHLLGDCPSQFLYGVIADHHGQRVALFCVSLSMVVCAILLFLAIDFRKVREVRPKDESGTGLEVSSEIGGLAG